MKSIGILSGMGAAAGAHFYGRLIRHCQMRGAQKDSDFPSVLLYNLPFNGTNKNGIESVEHFKADLKMGINILNDFRVDNIAITCNTAHLYLNELREISAARIISFVEAAQRECGEIEFGVICSRTSKEEKLYWGASIITSDLQQKVVDGLIDKAISGQIEDSDGLALLDIVFSMLKQGAEKIILGCTELPLLLARGEPSLFLPNYIIDPGECVIKQLLKGASA